MTNRFSRHERSRDADPRSVPLPVPNEKDLVLVDTTWGKIQPLQPFPGVQTVGELELIRLVGEGAALIDTRVAGSRSGETLPDAVSIPHDQIRDRIAELDKDKISIVFCNGPQCPQTPDAIGILLEAGYPPSSLAYYRGGLHDWVTLAFPTDPV
jgi:rhodanese-related sulfurtransferase